MKGLPVFFDPCCYPCCSPQQNGNPQGRSSDSPAFAAAFPSGTQYFGFIQSMAVICKIDISIIKRVAKKN
jgi:hypothetical protein